MNTGIMKIKTFLLAFVCCFSVLGLYAQNGYELSSDERETIEQRVIEKIDDFLSYLPEIAAMAVQVPGRRASACSKYALCRRFD